MKKIILTEIYFWGEKTKGTRKLGCKYIRINTSIEGYNAYYEASRVQTFINEFKNEKLKKLGESKKKK